jgi:hypothetical protein
MRIFPYPLGKINIPLFSGISSARRVPAAYGNPTGIALLL